MVDPLSIAGSIAGLITLVGSVIQLSSSYASNNTDDLLERLRLLDQILRKLKAFFCSEKRDKRSLDGESVLFRAINNCQGKLEDLFDKLEQSSRKRTLSRISVRLESLKRPFVEEGYKELLANLDGYIQTFSFSLSIDGCDLLSKTSAEVSKTLQSQRETLLTIQELSRGFSNLSIAREDVTKASEQISAIQQLISSFCDLSKDVSGLSRSIGRVETILKDQQTKRLADEEVAENEAVLEWLSSTDFTSRHSDIRTLKTPGTGAWFIQCPTFRQWRDNPQGSCLWCPGIPGAGKTVMTSIVIDHLAAVYPESNVGIAWVHCDYKAEGQTSAKLLSSLIRQLAEQLSELPQEVKLFHKAYIDGTRRARVPALKSSNATTEELIRLLLSVISNFTIAFILVDAFDELPELDHNGRRSRDELASAFQSIAKTTKLLITSRPHQDLERRFFIDCLRIDIYASLEDVRSYVELSMQQHPNLHTLTLREPDLKQDICDKISKNAGGMFILVRLQLDQLGNQRSIRNVRRALEAIPGEISDIYEKTLTRICTQFKDHAELAMRCLAWIFYAHRPLTAIELRHALAVEPGDEALDPSGIHDLDFLLSICGGLVTLEHEHDTIRFVHYTVQEYLASVSERLFPDAEIFISHTCLTYLSFRSFQTGAIRCDVKGGPQALAQRRKDHPFLYYASHYWGKHARGRPELDRALFNMILRFLSDSKLSSTSQQLVYLGSLYTSGRFRFSPLHVAARCGLDTVVRHLLETHDVNILDSRGDTPLHWVARRGYASTARLLIQKGARPDQGCFGDYTAMYYAVGFRNEEVLECMLEAGYVPNVKNCGR